MKTMTRQILDELIDTYPRLSSQKEATAAACQLLVDCYRAGGKVLVCGNGGSAADAEHIVGELMKGFRLKRPIPEIDVATIMATGYRNAAEVCRHMQCGLPAISLVSHSALYTAFANDVGAEMAFAQQVYGYGRRGDLLIAISTSGSSKNVLHAAAVAKSKGMTSIALVGAKVSPLQQLCTVTIAAPSEITYQIQEYHLPVYHALCAMVEEEFFGA
jgi:D-sedoheptulose 7-phosphate isomerase